MIQLVLRIETGRRTVKSEVVRLIAIPRIGEHINHDGTVYVVRDVHYHTSGGPVDVFIGWAR